MELADWQYQRLAEGLERIADALERLADAQNQPVQDKTIGKDPVPRAE